MSPIKKALLSSAVAAQCLIGGLAVTTQAQAADIPDYFFKEWTVAKNCTEQHAGLAAQAATGLKFRIAADASQGGSYSFRAVNSSQASWNANWNGMKLEYRPGTPLTSVPADFECIPGQETSSPFLAMSGFAQSSEPYYEQEHWYGMATIRGQLEHVLIFPRAASSGPGAIIVMQSVTSGSAVSLDENGVIHAQ